MEGAKRRVPGRVGAAAVLLAASLVVIARVMGASWQQVVSGALGCFVSALAASSVQWLATGGPLRLERRPPEDAARRPGRSE